MKHLICILLSFFFYSTGFGQLKKKDLIGDWQSNNDDSLYYRTDTIKFFQNINHFYQKETCNLISWTIDKKIFKISNVFTCTEPGRVSSFIASEKLRLKNTDLGQILTLKRNNLIFDKFKVAAYKEKRIASYPFDVKELQLIRFDKLTDFKLYKYVDSLIYKVLQYDSTLFGAGYQISHGHIIKPTDKKVKDGYPLNPEPLITLNGHIVDDKEILKKFRFVETTGIAYLTKEESVILYGLRAVNGAIIMTVSNKRFKKVWKTK